MNEEIEKLKQTNDKLYFALCAMMDVNGGVAVMPTPEAKQQNRALNQARDAIADARGEGYAEYCCKCKIMLPAYTHDAICQRCDMMAEIYKQGEVIEGLTAALKEITEVNETNPVLVYQEMERIAKAAIEKAKRREG